MNQDEIKKHISKSKERLMEEISNKKKEVEKLEAMLEEIPAETKIDVYLHSDKESMYDDGKGAGLTKEQLDKFVYACGEVKLTLRVDECGVADIIAVDDRRVEKK